MKVSYQWLTRLVDLEGITPHALGEGLTNAGLEVESTDPVAIAPHCVVGIIVACVDHPDSDHLHVCQVDVGSETLQIVCGAPNVRAGQHVIVALDGAQLPGGLIRSSSIRGQQSNGMICSLLELGVNEKYVSEASKTGIEVLPEWTEPGSEPLAVLGLDDTVLDIKQTPNRSDFLSMFAIAKEVGAIFDRHVTLPASRHLMNEGQSTSFAVHSFTEKNLHFLAKVIGSVTIKPSAPWIVQALHSSGIKSINNVVDISNLVMLETGQPMHFYDFASFSTPEITVKDGLNQDVVALDGETYHLLEEDIVITSGNEPIGIAGIMGLGDSMIRSTTTSLVIEVAGFEMISIRKTAKRLGLSTESSQRYSKPMDPLAGQLAMERAVELLVEYADAKDLEALISVKPVDYSPTEVMVTASKVNAVLGTNLSVDTIYDVFKRLDFQPRLEEHEVFFTTIPSYRQDILIGEDLIEEVIRIVGYDTIESTLPLLPQTIGQLTPLQRNIRLIESTLIGFGLNQVVTYTLVSKDKTNGLDALVNPYQLLSPLSEERAYVRNQLVQSELEMLAYNSANKNTEGYYFEQSVVYGEQVNENRLAVIGTNALMSPNWQGIMIPSDFYTVKGILIRLLSKLGYNENRISVEANDDNIELYHPGRSAKLIVDRQLIGYFGQIHPTQAKRYKLKEVLYAEISLTKLFALKQAKIQAKPIVRYPSVTRDIAAIVGSSTPSAALLKTIHQAGKPFLKDVMVSDVFTSSALGLNKKSLTLKLTFQSERQTLNEEEINQAMVKVVSDLKEKNNVEFRD